MQMLVLKLTFNLFFLDDLHVSRPPLFDKKNRDDLHISRLGKMG